MLNNLLGRFGIGLDKPVTQLLSNKTYKVKSLMNKIVNYKELNKDKVLLTYIPKLNPEIIKSYGLDIVKILNKHKDSEIQSLEVSSIVISAAVNAYARIYMQELKLTIIDKGGDIYYSDTDSIVTNMKLDNSLVDEKALGKLKLEYIIDKAIFIAPKLYCLVTKEGEIIIKAKGINKNSLTFNDFFNLLENPDKKTVSKTQSIKNWENGYVLIKDILVNISSETYNKRNKVYDKGKWIDTKPLNILTKTKINDINYKVKSLEVHKDYPLTYLPRVKDDKVKPLTYIPVIKDDFNGPKSLDNNDKAKPLDINEEISHKEASILSVFTLFTSKIILASFCLMLYFLDLDEFSSLVIREENNNNYNGFYCNELPVLEENFLLEDKPFIKESYNEESSLEDSSSEDSSLSFTENDFSNKTLYEGFKEWYDNHNHKETLDIDKIRKEYEEVIMVNTLEEVRRGTVVNFDELDSTQKACLDYMKNTYSKDILLDSSQYYDNDYKLTENDKTDYVLAKESYYNNSTKNSYYTLLEVIDKRDNSYNTIVVENVPLDDIRRKYPTFVPDLYVVKAEGAAIRANPELIPSLDEKSVHFKSYVDALESQKENINSSNPKETSSEGLWSEETNTNNNNNLTENKSSSLEVSPKTKSELWTPKLPQESFNDTQDKSLWKDNLNTPEQKFVENLKPSPVRDSTIESITKDNDFKEKLYNRSWMEKESYNLDSLFDEKKD